MRKFVVSSLAAMLLSAPLFAEEFSYKNIEEANQTLADDEAFILVKMGARGALRQYVSSLNFSESGQGFELKVPKDTGFQLLRVKAGTYSPEAMDVKDSKSMQAKAFDDPDKAQKSIVIEHGTVTYIGQWDIAYGQRFQVMDSSFITDESGFRVSYSVESVSEFAEQNEWVTNFPLRFSHISGQNVATTWKSIDQERIN